MRGTWPRFLVLAGVAAGMVVPAAPLVAQFQDERSGGRFGGQFGGFGAFGQPAEPVVTVSAQFTAPSPEQPSRLFVTATIKPPWHIYSITQAPGGPVRTEIELKESAAYRRVGDFQAITPPERKAEKVFGGLVVETHHGSVTWYAPIELKPGIDPATIRIEGVINAQACSTACLMPQDYPFTAVLVKEMEIPADAGGTARREQPMDAGGQEPPQTSPYSYDTWVYMLLALVAGLSINVLPCVLPVIPIILMRLFEQSKESSGKRLAQGAALCFGIILFFGGFALVSAIINMATGAVLDLNDLFRYPAAGITLFLAIILFALMMLDVIPVILPSSIAGRQSTGTGFAASIGVGFLVAVLSTPCSGALLGFVLVWAQTQPRIVSSTAITLMGVGMALPYAIIVGFPALLNWLPKPGIWMEIFKKSCGFLLFFIAVKLTLAALPKERLVNVLLYGVVFGFCVWMWGKWVDFSTPATRKWSVRGIALAIAVGAGLWLLPSDTPPEGASVKWQHYDSAQIQACRSGFPVILLKFTAEWCTNCKIVEKEVYRDPEVVKQLRNKGVLTVKADTTSVDAPATQDFRNVYGEAGAIPVTILLVPDQPPIKLRGVFEKDELLTLLEKLPDLEQEATKSNAFRAAREDGRKTR